MYSYYINAVSKINNQNYYLLVFKPNISFDIFYCQQPCDCQDFFGIELL